METKAKNFYESVIPAHWGVEVKTENELINLGGAFLERLARYWFERENFLLRTSIDCMNLRDAVTNRTTRDIQLEASKYNSPVFINSVITAGYERRPSEAELSRQFKDSTTFNRCGWCKFCEGDCGTGECSFSGQCALTQQDVSYDTCCSLTKCDDQFIEDCAKRISSRLNDIDHSRQEAHEMFAKLTRLSFKKIERKPAIAHLRPKDWFRVGDRVVYITQNQNSEPSVIYGNVAYGYRHHDDSVTIVLDYKIRNGVEGNIVSVYVNSPTVLQQWEFNYLKNHSDFREVWSKYLHLSDTRNETETRNLFEKLF